MEVGTGLQWRTPGESGPLTPASPANLHQGSGDARTESRRGHDVPERDQDTVKSQSSVFVLTLPLLLPSTRRNIAAPFLASYHL